MLGNYNQEHSEYLLYIEAHTLKLSSLEISFVNPYQRNKKTHRISNSNKKPKPSICSKNTKWTQELNVSNNIEGWTKERKKQTQILIVTQRPKPHLINLSTNQIFLTTKTKPTHYINQNGEIYIKKENEIQNEFQL